MWCRRERKGDFRPLPVGGLFFDACTRVFLPFSKIAEQGFSSPDQRVDHVKEELFRRDPLKRTGVYLERDGSTDNQLGKVIVEGSIIGAVRSGFEW